MAVPALIDAMKGSSPAIRKGAVRSLVAMGRPSAVSSTLVRALTEALSDADLRFQAVEALGNLGAAARPAIPALKTLRADVKGKDRVLEERIAEAIGKIG